MPKSSSLSFLKKIPIHFVVICLHVLIDLGWKKAITSFKVFLTIPELFETSTPLTLLTTPLLLPKNAPSFSATTKGEKREVRIRNEYLPNARPKRGSNVDPIREIHTALHH